MTWVAEGVEGLGEECRSKGTWEGVEGGVMEACSPCDMASGSDLGGEGGAGEGGGVEGGGAEAGA